MENKTAEGNKLIAEFMGAKIIPNQGDAKIDHFIIDGNRLAIWDLKYNTSWDWLMPVSLKINQELTAISQTIKSDKGCSWVSKQANLQNIDDCRSAMMCDIWGVRIDSAHNGAVEIIKYINSGKWNRKKNK